MSHTRTLTHSITRHQLGMTLIELMVTLSILAILTSLAAPSFMSTIDRWSASQAISSLESALFHARTESIRRGTDLILSRRGSNSSCTATSDTDWRCGWTLTPSSDKSNILQDSPKLSSDISLNPSANATEIRIDRWGGMQLGDAGYTFSFTATPSNTQRAATSARKLCISAGGQMRQMTAKQSC